MSATIQKIRDASEAVLYSLTEQELAMWLAARGEKVVHHNGRYWRGIYPGFYCATHPMAKMSAEEATRPHPLCWGFRTTLCEADAGRANATLPLHLLTDVAGYTWQSLGSRCRNKLRNMRKKVRIVALTGPDLLLERGYEVLCSAHARNRYGSVPDRTGYRKRIMRYFEGGRCLVLCGLIDDQPAGYLTGYAVGPTAYVDELYLHSAYLRTNISLGLFFDWMQACRRNGSIREIVHGLHAREAPGLCRYKEELGLSVVHVPARVWFAPPAGMIVKTLRPDAYYRLTGHD
jgi:hypothetical protein